jgi:hypothetical protein
MNVYFAAIVAAVVAIALQVRAEPVPERGPDPAPAREGIARPFPGPIVNGQRRQPTPRDVSQRLRAAMLESAAADAARRDAEVEEIFRTLNMPPR